MAILLVVALVLLVGFALVLRHSRNFRGSGEHFADEIEAMPPEIKTSKGWPRSDGGAV